MPLISVIMACHNAAPYVGQAIKSVLHQTYTDLELIFVDDKSSDESLSVAQRFAQSDGRLKIYANRVNLGAGLTRNLAIEKATGEWLAILDADDVFIKDKLAQQVALIKSTKDDLVLVGSGCFHIDSRGESIAVYHYPSTSKALKNRLIRHKAFPPHSSIVYLASAVRSIGGYNEFFSPAEDFEFLLRMRKIGAFACVKAPLVEYRLHNTNISISMARTRFTQFEYAVAASACDILRERGFVDPGSAGDKALWERFMQHVALEARISGELDYRKWKELWSRQNPCQTSKFSRKYLMLKYLVLNPAKGWRLLNEHTAGNNFPRLIVASWLKQSACAVFK